MRADAAEARADAVVDLREAFAGVQAALRRLRGRESQRTGVGISQWRLLSALAREGELSAGQLATASELTPATVTQMLDRLVADGVVDRRRSETDRRAVVCRLTPAGREQLVEAEARFVARWEQVLADLTEEELVHGARVLERLRELFDGL